MGDYLHHLPELARKPQALRQVASELMRQLGEPFAAIWRALVGASDPKDAARQFARVLAAVVADGLDVVAARLRRAFDNDLPLALALAGPAVPLPQVTREALPAGLAGVEVDAGSAADYDALCVVNHEPRNRGRRSHPHRRAPAQDAGPGTCLGDTSAALGTGRSIQRGSVTALEAGAACAGIASPWVKGA